MTSAKEVLELDKYNLDVEFENQSLYVHEWLTKLADAKRDVEDLERQLKLTTADVAKKVRANPAKFGLEKATDGGVRSACEHSAAVMSIEKEIMEAKHQVSLIDAVCKALEHKKRALTVLADLHARDYYSRPVATDAAKEQMAVARRTKLRGAIRGMPAEDDDDDDDE